MKLKTTVILAVSGILVSAAGAFAVPVAHPSVAVAEPKETPTTGVHTTAGDTLVIDARLGHTQLAKASSGETYLFAQVGAASDAVTAAVTPMNLALVIDRSGSMKGERIANAMNAAVFALERMRDGDSISVVAFDTAAQVVVAPTTIAAGNRPAIEAAIRSIRLGGDTCISCGLQEAMAQISRSAPSPRDAAGRLDRMILLSDGVTNAGVRDMPGMRAMANRMHGRGVTISTIGVDVDFDEKMMAAIANEANGRHYFVANASGLAGVFGQEFDDVLASVASDAELTITLAPGVEVAEVFDRSFRREGDKLIVPFGTFSGKQEKTILVKLRVPTDREGDAPVADLKLAYRDLVKKTNASSDASLALAIKDSAAALDPFVAARLERSRTAQTLTEANTLFEAGRIGEARAKLASRGDDLKKSEAVALAAPNKPLRNARPLDRDFDDQRAAIAQADTAFAAPPATAGGSLGAAGPKDGRFAQPPAPAPREGKAQVRTNQERAFDMAF